MKPRLSQLTVFAIMTLSLACLLVARAYPQVKGQGTNPPAQQKLFATPQAAAQALIQAASSYDEAVLLDIFGPGGKDLIASADPVRDKSNAAAFVAKASEKNDVKLDPKAPNRALVVVGNDEWPLPVPLVKKAGRWFFDTTAGREEILHRRIGANELDAIQVCRGYVEAQHEYAAQRHDNSGINQYAQKIMSSPGKEDGLYWMDADGQPAGPIGEAIARALQEGYTAGKGPYHGYYFKILKGQGPAAPLGKLDYVIQGAMIGGFALVAVPAQYRVTGVQTFVVAQDGIVYQKDLGPKSLELVKNMELYDPDKTWHRTDDQWPADVTERAPGAAKQ